MRAAILGVGFMGWIHTLAYRRSQHADLAGFASRDEKKRAGDWRGIQGNFGPPGEQIDLNGLTVCEDLAGLLADDTIDLIDICLPPHLHVEAVAQTLAAGKKVLCEKPLALDAAAADQLTSLAVPGQLMVGHILPFMPEFAFLVEAANDNRFGKIMGGRFQRSISPPDWIPDFYDPARVGGPLVDLQVHDAHLVRLLFGMPAAAHTSHQLKSGVPKRYETVFEFAESQSGLAGDPVATEGGGQIVCNHPPVVSVAGGVIDSPARPFTHGYEVAFEEATIRFEFAAYNDGSSDSIPLTIMHNNGTVERPDISDNDPIDAFVREIDAAARSMESGKIHPALDPELATDALRISEMQMPAWQEPEDTPPPEAKATSK